MSELWQNLIIPPLPGRKEKPRSSGITMLLDKGLSPAATIELLEMNSAYVDLIKLSFGTTALYPPPILAQKITVTRKYDICIYPGGTFFEIALWQDKAREYFNKLIQLGFSWVEISDGSLEISPLRRYTVIKQAQAAGLKVISEVGKKEAGNQPDPKELIQKAIADLEAGVEWVIIEARESGQGIGIYDNQGASHRRKTNAVQPGVTLGKNYLGGTFKKTTSRLNQRFWSQC